MAKPTHSPTRTVFHGRSLISGSVVGPKIGTAAVGITQAATAIKRNLEVVSLGNTPATGFKAPVFRAPASGATITAAYFCPGSVQNHAVNETDTWLIRLISYPKALYLHKNKPSLSNQTLAATMYKQLPVNGGNSSLLSGESLFVSTGVSGSPTALWRPALVIEWVPKSNA